MHAILKTNLSREQCQLRLSTALASDSAWSISSPQREIYGRINGTSFRLHKRSFGGDPYRPFLEGEFIQYGTGSEIRCTTRKALSIDLLTSIWFIGLFCIGGLMMIGSLWAIITNDTHNVQGNPWVGVFAPPGLRLFGVVSHRICKCTR
jgi:hypothetical protein